jgi:hypothetical protein
MLRGHCAILKRKGPQFAENQIAEKRILSRAGAMLNCGPQGAIDFAIREYAVQTKISNLEDRKLDGTEKESSRPAGFPFANP